MQNESTARMMGPALPPSPPTSEQTKSPQRRGAERRRQIPDKQKKAYVAEWLLTGMTQRDFVKEKDLPLSSFGNWVRRWRDKLQSQQAAQGQLPIPATGKEMSTAVQTRTKHEQKIEELQRVVHELESKLADERLKNKSLMNVVILLGHQVDED